MHGWTSKKVGMKWYEDVTKHFEKDFLVTFQGGSSWNWRSFIDLIIKSCNVVDRRVVYLLWMFESVEGLCSAAKYAWEENTNLKRISLKPFDSTSRMSWNFAPAPDEMLGSETSWLVRRFCFWTILNWNSNIGFVTSRLPSKIWPFEVGELFFTVNFH